MVDFPSIRESDWKLFKQSAYKKQERTPMESGKVHSRPVHTTSKELFTIGWEWLTIADYNTLRTFFIANIGGTFEWTHIHTEVVWTVRFTEDVFPELSFLGANFALGPKELMIEEA